MSRPQSSSQLRRRHVPGAGVASAALCAHASPQDTTDARAAGASQNAALLAQLHGLEQRYQHKTEELELLAEGQSMLQQQLRVRVRSGWMCTQALLL